MSSNQFDPKSLMFKSTASIIHNIGFSTTKPSSLNILNNLLVVYFEHLCKTWKLLLEEADGNNDKLKHALTVFRHNSYFDCNEFKDFLESTVSSVTNVKPLPYFPVKLPEVDCNASKIVFNDTTHEDITLAQTNYDIFPEYFGLSAEELQMENLLADSRYINTRKSLRESLDSLASPVLAFCNPIRLRPTMFKQKPTCSKTTFSHQNLKSEQINNDVISLENNQTNYKAVHSVKGLKIRLLKDMENTPPGFFSSRLKKRKE